MSIFDQRMWTVQELAQFLRVSPATVYARLKDWPHIRVTPTDVRFSEDNVKGILALLTQAPVVPEPRRAPRVGTRATRRSGK
jgi:hypothetical protein